MSSCVKGESPSTKQLTDSYRNKSERFSKKLDADRFFTIEPPQGTGAAARSRQPFSSTNRGGRPTNQTVSVDQQGALILSLSDAELENMAAATSSDVKMT